MFEKDSEEYAKSRINENCSGSNIYRRIRKAYKDGADRGYGVGRWNYPNDGDPSKEALEYAGTVHRYRDSYGETEQMEDVAEAWIKGYEYLAKEIEKDGAVPQLYMDETIRQNMELKKILDDYRDFIAEKKLQEEFKRFLKEVEK